VKIGEPRQLNLTRIDDDKRGTPFLRVDDSRSDEGMLRRCIRPDDKKEIGFVTFVNGIRHGSRAECCGQTGHRRAVSEPCAVIHIVRLKGGARHFHKEIVFLVGHLGGTQKGKAPWTV